MTRSVREAEAPLDGVEHLQALGDHLGARSVAGKDRDPIALRQLSSFASALRYGGSKKKPLVRSDEGLARRTPAAPAYGIAITCESFRWPEYRRGPTHPPP